MKPEYLNWLKQEETVVTSEGKQVLYMSLLFKMMKAFLNHGPSIYESITVQILR